MLELVKLGPAKGGRWTWLNAMYRKKFFPVTVVLGSAVAPKERITQVAIIFPVVYGSQV